LAIEGDIVIPRVGKTKIGKVGVVKKGAFIPTDCVIVIKPSSEFVYNQILDTLCSAKGRQWLYSIIKGVATRHITLSDVQNFPILARDATTQHKNNVCFINAISNMDAVCL
jgi:hypothetical protein